MYGFDWNPAKLPGFLWASIGSDGAKRFASQSSRGGTGPVGAGLLANRVTH